MKASIVKQSKRKDSDVEEAFKRTYMAKKALYKLQGLENVSPSVTISYVWVGQQGGSWPSQASPAPMIPTIGLPALAELLLPGRR